MYVVCFACTLEWSRPLSGWFCIVMGYKLVFQSLSFWFGSRASRIRVLQSRSLILDYFLHKIVMLRRFFRKLTCLIASLNQPLFQFKFWLLLHIVILLVHYNMCPYSSKLNICNQLCFSIYAFPHWFPL